jgi:MFS family permease
VQGAGGALLVPGSLAIISASFAGHERGKAIGTWSGYSAMTAALGPVLGGFLIDHFSWRYAFLINVPLGLGVLALTYWRVPESRDTAIAGGVDWAGGLLATLGLGGTVYALIESSSKGWGDTQIVGSLALGVAALTAFVFVERWHPAPMLPLGLFRSRSFAAANVLTVLLYAALGGSLFFFPLDLIQGKGIRPHRRESRCCRSCCSCFCCRAGRGAWPTATARNPRWCLAQPSPVQALRCLHCPISAAATGPPSFRPCSSWDSEWR